MKSQYKYVYYHPEPRQKTKAGINRALQTPWVAFVTEYVFGQSKTLGRKYFATDREAAIHVDRILLEHGREPVNILKRKQP